MSPPANPRKAWLLFACVLLCGIAGVGFFGFLITYDPAEAETALHWRLVYGTAFALAVVGLVLVWRAFNRLPREAD